jgi:GntP family gluconate:H+ symporter
MLRAAKVGEAITAFVSDQGSVHGTQVLLLGFAIAVILKIAQGSSTVAMITTATMVGSMGITTSALGFHAVYLCTAIGSGSLVGSWMNDSGFWIFSRMSGITEVEALKSWTILLVVLGCTGLAFTLIYARLFPLLFLGG